MPSSLARLTCEAVGVGGRTNITQLSARAPAKFIPMRNTTQQQSGAAWVALGGYGGGLLGGDHINLSVRAEAGSTLALTTQSSQKVYHAKPDGKHSGQTLDATVGADALLCLTPDPLVPFKGSRFTQKQSIRLEDATASALVVDWVGAGRASRGERWQFSDYCKNAE